MVKIRKRKQPIVQPPSSISKSASISAQSCRTVIRRFHVLLKRKRQLETEPSSSTAIVQINKEIVELGGLEHYQELSNLGQSKERGGGTEKVLIGWLKELGVRPTPPREKLRLLEVGALRHDNYGSCSSWIDWLPIDLNSRHPKIKEQDFLQLDVETNSERWDLISLSLVVNFVPEPIDRGRMLRLAHNFLAAHGLLFLALPLPCVSNSRYLTFEHLEELMGHIGFHQIKDRWKSGGRMGYWLYRKQSPPGSGSSTPSRLHNVTLGYLADEPDDRPCKIRCSSSPFPLSTPNRTMRFSAVRLQALAGAHARSTSTSFIGLGRMGHQMALNLFSKQYAQDSNSHFVVCDVLPESAQSFCREFTGTYPEAKISIASTPAEAASASKNVVTMLPSSPQVKTVYNEGIIPTLQAIHQQEPKAETVCIDSTTLDVEVAREVASAVIKTGAQMIDAPVSGGVTGAQAGTLSFLVGGTEAGYDLAKPLLALMGQRIIYCGPSGAGLGAKICNNLVLGVQQIAIAEAMLLGQALGLEPATLASVINSSTGGCWASSVNNPVPSALPGKSPPCERGYEGGFATKLMLKDMGLASAIAKKEGTALPLGLEAERLYGEVVSKRPELGDKDFSNRPAVLIIGGLNTCSRSLAAYLVPPDAEPRVSHLRIVDKYSVTPATTYVGPQFPKVLDKPNVEYRQANITVPTTVHSIFEPPQGRSAFDYVFDFTGEVRHDRTEMIQINTTFTVARLLGQEAAARNVKAYVRIHQPFFETTGKTAQDEKADIKPSGISGTWWHESLRVLGSIPNLNLVVLRLGFVYGPYTNFGNIATAMTVASVYGYSKKPMKSLWSPGKNPMNTIHVDDVAGASWAVAGWIATQGRDKALELAGAPIPFHNDKNKVNDVEGMVPHTENIVVPVFNLVDDSNSTLLSTGTIICNCFNTTFEFFNLVESTIFKVLEDIDDVNEEHVAGWTQMITTSKNGPIVNSPLTAYMDKYALEKHVVSLDNSKIKSVVGYTLAKPQFEQSSIQEIVSKWKDEGIWPIND